MRPSRQDFALIQDFLVPEKMAVDLYRQRKPFFHTDVEFQFESMDLAFEKFGLIYLKIGHHQIHKSEWRQKGFLGSYLVHDQSWNKNYPVMNDREGLPKRRSVRMYRNQYPKVGGRTVHLEAPTRIAFCGPKEVDPYSFASGEFFENDYWNQSSSFALDGISN